MKHPINKRKNIIYNSNNQICSAVFVILKKHNEQSKH